jgi:hypothetical protein
MSTGNPAKPLAKAALLLALSPLAVATAQANQVPEVRGHSETFAAGKSYASWIWARDAEGDRISFAITRQPKYGTVKLDWNTGRFEYIPTQVAKFDTFEYRATDSKGWSEPAVVHLNMLAADGSSGNRAPEAANQSQRVDAANPANGKLWAYDADGHALTFTVIDWPRLGQLKVDTKTGQYTYRAHRNENGNDQFSYRVSDGRANSTIAFVKLELRANGTTTPTTPTNPTNPPVTPPGDAPLDPNLRSKADFSPLVKEVLSTEFFVEHFNHAKPGRLEAVAAAVDFLARQQNIQDKDLDTLLYYLRAYNYYAGLSKATPAQQQMVERALYQVSRLNDMLVYQKASAKVIEGYVVALGGLVSSKEGSALVVRHLPRLIDLLHHFNTTPQLSAEHAYGDTAFQLLNLFDRFGFVEGALRDALVRDTRFLDLIAALGSGRNALWKNNDGFIVYNAIEALGKLERLAGSGSWRSTGDAAVQRIMRAHLGQGKLDDQELKSNFREYYVDFAYEGKVDETCAKTFPGLCYRFEITEVLPQTHTCGPTLKVRSQPLPTSRLSEICSTLARQEGEFHRIMQTNWQPVADDKNTSLELVIFSSSDNYKKYAGLLYGISTDNGGMYIEGSPDRDGNQARFFAYVRENPTWQVWNLNHEYVHYLDGRFNQYGPFGHYPLNITTWWSEGLAEYLAWGKHFERGMNDVSNVPQHQRPSLNAIANLSYESGSSMVYHWSYTLHRFLQERDPQRHLALAGYLKRNDVAGYRRAMAELEQVYGSYYPSWRDQLITDWQNRPRTAASLQATLPIEGDDGHQHATARQRSLDPSASLARPPRD